MTQPPGILFMHDRDFTSVLFTLLTHPMLMYPSYENLLVDLIRIEAEKTLCVYKNSNIGL